MRIAFIGLGEMGRRMCLRLIKNGHSVTVYNRSAAKADALVAQGAQLASTLVEACQGAELAISMVRDDAASREVWSEDNLRQLKRTNQPLIAMEMSTLSRSETKELAGRMKDHRINFLAAPVIGSLAPAEAGKLLILLGGDHALAPRLTEVLQTLGDKMFWLSTPESAAVLKLAVNHFFAVQVQGLVETLKLVIDESVLPKEELFEIFKGLPIVSPPMAGIIGLIAKNDFSASFPIHLVAKDLRYFNELGTKQESRLRLSRIFEAAIAAGLGPENIHAIWKLEGLTE